jgi:hypothetical protein
MSSSKADRARQRRRILQAAVGAPVVLTLPSGAVLAAGSLSCAEKSQERAATELPAGLTTVPGDTWMRYRLQKYTGAGLNYVVLDTSNWYLVDEATGAATALSAAPSPLPTAVADTYYYALVNFETYSDTAPEMLKIYPGTSPVSSPIAGESCWNSLMGTALGSNILP